MNSFNVIVIGKGLVGTAAAKYLSSYYSKVAVIGPDEPMDYDKSIVFASHYDQARVQRMIGKDEVWTRLNTDSVKHYEAIRMRSGIDFHNPVGCLYVNPIGKDGYLEKAKSLSDRFNLPFKAYVKGQQITSDFSGFSFPANAKGLFEASPSGFINPRLLLKAQLNILEQNNGMVLKETVLDVFYTNNEFHVTTYEGNSYRTPKILLATGSFTNFFNLTTKKLDLKLKSEVILLVKVSDEQASKLAALPSLLYEINNVETKGIYLIQPVKYPDGAYYLKMGCNMPEDIYFENIEQVQEWFRSGDSNRFSGRLTQALKLILPEIELDEYFTKRCIISRSAHGRPYIGETAQPGLHVASGCNGYSAMCSDAIGNVAAHLIINGTVPTGYSSKSFKLLYSNGSA